MYLLGSASWSCSRSSLKVLETPNASAVEPYIPSLVWMPVRLYATVTVLKNCAQQRSAAFRLGTKLKNLLQCGSDIATVVGQVAFTAAQNGNQQQTVEYDD